MKTVAILFLVCVCAIAVYSKSLDEEWQDFKVKFNRNYGPEEEAKRKQIFAETLKEVTAHNEKYNRGEVSYSQGINDFADKTTEERRQYLGVRPPPRN